MKKRTSAYTLRRLGKRLVRAAYEYEHLSSRMRYDGLDSEANGVNAISSQLGKIGRGLLDKAETGQ